MAVTYTTTVDGFDYGFDFDDQRIDIDVGVVNIDVINLYTAIKEAQASEVGIVYPQIGRGEGRTVLSGSISTFLTVSLLDNWEVNTLQTSGNLQVSGGNLVRADESDPFRDNPLITYINNLSQAGVVAETGVSGLTPAESIQLSNAANPAITWSHPVEGSFTAEEVLRIMSAALAGKLSGAGGTNIAIRDINDTTDRITATVDANGNRSAVTLDES